MEFIETYFSEYIKCRSVQEAILKEYVKSFFGKDITRITNSLFRGGIFSLKKLYDTPLEEIANLRNIGPKALEAIQNVKRDMIAQMNSHDHSTL